MLVRYVGHNLFLTCCLECSRECPDINDVVKKKSDNPNKVNTVCVNKTFMRTDFKLHPGPITGKTFEQTKCIIGPLIKNPYVISLVLRSTSKLFFSTERSKMNRLTPFRIIFLTFLNYLAQSIPQTNKPCRSDHLCNEGFSFYFLLVPTEQFYHFVFSSY